MSMGTDYLQRLPELVGRHQESEQALEAMHCSDRNSVIVVFVEGEAGIGKTRFLQETPYWAKRDDFLMAPIIDFYDSAVHSYSAIEEILAQCLKPAAFKGFYANRHAFERLRAAGVPTAQLEEKRLKVWEAFRDDYNYLANQVGSNRIILRFDTAELLEYEHDTPEVIEDCEVPLEEAPAWGWLTKRLLELKNTTVFIAGRSCRMSEDLKTALGPSFRPIQLKGLTKQEVRAYFRKTVKAELGDEALDRIYALTDGKPILVSLAADWLSHGIWDEQLFPLDPPALRFKRRIAEAERNAGQEGDAWEEWKQIQRRFEIALVQRFRGLEEQIDRAIFCVSLARKGCGAELLAHMMDKSLPETKDLVSELEDLSFVKRRTLGNQNLLFLHDRMYDLIEHYVGLDDYSPESEQKQLLGSIIKWYETKIHKLGEEIKLALDPNNRRILRREQQLLWVEWLYYQFEYEPDQGYEHYRRLSLQALQSHEFGWETRLRVETLRFLRQRAWKAQLAGLVSLDTDHRVSIAPLVNWDCRRRWLERYISRADYARAVRIATKLLDKYPDAPLDWRGGMRITLATAQTYMGGHFTESALNNFAEAIQALEILPMSHKEHWLYSYHLGTAYLYQGLALANAVRLNEAMRANARAIHWLRQIAEGPRLAEALNNQAYVYARQGRFEVARTLCDEALAIRQGLGDEYDIGLGLNTKGVIYERMDRPITAIHNSQEALSLFRRIGSERGIILADINLGRSYRRKARSREWGQRDEDFEGGKNHLEEALHLQDKLGTSADMFYRIEANNEMGCLYRDWAATLRERAIDNGRLQGYLDLGRQYLKKAIQLTLDADGQVVAGQEVQHIDNLEDLSRVFFLQAGTGSKLDKTMLLQMDSLLTEAEDKAHDYHRRRREKWDELDLILGKIYFQRARLASLRQSWDQVTSFYAKAAGHIESYSLDAPELRKLVADASRWLSTLEAEEVQHRVKQMRETLVENNLKGDRLHEWISSVVLPGLGLEWPENRQEI